MDIDFSIITLSTIALGCFVSLVTFFSLITWSKKNRSTRPSPPEPAGSWPIIGHLHLLGGKKAPHEVFAKLADQYGPIFKIRLGMRQVVVVSNSEMAKECLLTNDKDFAGRPRLIAFEHLMYNHAIFSFVSSGPYWREARRISIQELLSIQRQASMMYKKVSEVRAAIKNVYDKWILVSENQGVRSNDSSSLGRASVVEMREWFGSISMNMIMEEVVGKSFRKYTSKDEADKCLRAMREFFHLTGIFTVADALPYLRFLDIGGYESSMRKTAIEFGRFAQEWLESHRKNQEDNRVDIKRDFMDILIGIFDKGNARVFDYDADTIIKATSLTMVIAASDTTSVSLTWALCLLLNNPRTMKKVKKELDTHVGRDRMLNIESDLSNLVYLHAVIKETLRLYPAVPLMIPHEAMADVVVGGYHIPVGTMLFVNVHKIQRDPLAWDDPLVFHPERFLNTKKHIDVKGQHFELIPFSSGRRVCPGISYALQTLHFTLASLLHCFDITTLSCDPVDMTESKGLTNFKATPLEVILTPRLPRPLYEEIDY